MPRMRVAAFVALALAQVLFAAAQVVAAGSPVTNVRGLWTLRSDVPAPSDATRIGPVHVYLRDASGAHAELRTWLGALDLTEDEWLRGSATGCHMPVAGDVIHCVGLTVAEAKRRFGAALDFGRFSKRGVAPLSSGSPPLMVLAANPDAVTVPETLRRRVVHVSGVAIYDHREGPVASALASLGSAQTDGSTLAANVTAFPNASQFPGHAPVFASASGESVGVLLRCRNGAFATFERPVNHTNASSFGDFCPSDIYTIRNVSITFVPESPLGNSSNVPATPFKVALRPQHCVRAAARHPTLVASSPDEAEAPLCGLMNTDKDWPLPDTRFNAYQTTATVYFTDGTNATSHPFAFFGGAVMRGGAADPTDLSGNAVLSDTIAPVTTFSGGPLDFRFEALWGQYGVPAAATAPHMGQGAAVFVDMTDTRRPRVSTRMIQRSFDLYWQLSTRGAAAKGTLQFLSLGKGEAFPSEVQAHTQLLAAGAPNSATVVLSVEYGGAGAPFATYQDAMAGFASAAVTRFNAPEPGRVAAVSTWMLDSVGPEWHASKTLRDRCESTFARGAAIGVTFVSGTGGTGAVLYDVESDHPSFYAGVSYPASSQSVIAVAASAFVRTPGSATPAEVAANARWGHGITAAGGESQLITATKEQRQVTGRVLRSTPDIAASGVAVAVVLNRVPVALSSSAASAAVFTGMITLLNELRRNAPDTPEEKADGANTTLLRVPLRNAHRMLYAGNIDRHGAFDGIAHGDTCAGAQSAAARAGSAPGLNFPLYAASRCNVAQGLTCDLVTGLGAPSYVALSGLARRWNGDGFGAEHVVAFRRVVMLLVVVLCSVAAGGTVLFCVMRIRRKQRRSGRMAFAAGHNVSGFGGGRSGVAASTYGSL
uniref:Peptidase S53 domain-containing protein n=1 Tax=Neobodo designis TaxID=312471 RepID=A0A7S1LPH4_NEODS